MPRIWKTLPPERGEYSFGDLLYWHLFEYGTRPSGVPTDTSGRVWEALNFADLIGVTDRMLRNYIQDRNLPSTTAAIEQELFGDERRWDGAREELRTKLRAAWQARSERRESEKKASPSPSRASAEPGECWATR